MLPPQRNGENSVYEHNILETELDGACMFKQSIDDAELLCPQQSEELPHSAK